MFATQLFYRATRTLARLDVSVNQMIRAGREMQFEAANRR